MASDPREPCSSFSAEGSLVRLRIGPNQEEVIVSASIVHKMPPMLQLDLIHLGQKTLGNGLLITESRMVMEMDSDTIMTYLYYIETGKIKCKFDEGDPYEDADDKEYNLLAKLYRFGVRYQDVLLVNTVVDALAAKSQSPAPDGREPLPSAYVIGLLFDYSYKNSPVRKLLVDMHVNCRDPQSINWPMAPSATEFLIEIVTKVLGKQDDRAEGTNMEPTSLDSNDDHEI